MIDHSDTVAAELACRAHGDQRYGTHPYRYHLLEVVRRMRTILDLPSMIFFDRQVAIAGAWLHDVLEDTRVTHDELVLGLGSRVASLVHAVTDEPGANRRERKAKTYPKIRAAGPLAVGLKLADRLANVQESLLSDGRLLDMYRKEQEGLEMALHLPSDGLDSVWEHLRFMLS